MCYGWNLDIDGDFLQRMVMVCFMFVVEATLLMLMSPLMRLMLGFFKLRLESAIRVTAGGEWLDDGIL